MKSKTNSIHSLATTKANRGLMLGDANGRDHPSRLEATSPLRKRDADLFADARLASRLASMKIVILGLSITSSWGNGHATTYRGLVRELAAQGHDVLFL